MNAPTVPALCRRVLTMLSAALLALPLASCVGTMKNADRDASLATPPPAPREFRAAWVATVANIDWPSKPGLPVAQQQAELLRIVEIARAMNLNALIVQVRPGADALYPSALEPWSEYLTGEQGKAPEPFYDPLRMWIDECHKRGIELHAWFNPYRARHPKGQLPRSPAHIANARPALVKTYGDYLWLDPGEPAAAQHSLDVILDVVRRYDIDGVHIDDYFYPYPLPVPGQTPAAGAASTIPQAAPAELDFPDDASWAAYVLGGGTLARADWRRRNVDSLVERLYDGIRREKSWVKFGVSPFGVGRPDRRPPGIAGFSQYDKLYADVELWLERGWLDYLAPQLYWPIDQAPQAYGVLLNYWLAQNARSRHVWPGLFTSRIDDTAKSWTPQEILNQVALTRARGVNGHMHFSMVTLLENRKQITTGLATGAYAMPALVPATPWLDNAVPPPPAGAVRASMRGSRSVRLVVTPGAGKRAALFAVWTRYGNEWRFATATADGGDIELEASAPSGALGAIVVSAVDRVGNESARVFVSPAASPVPGL